MLFLCFISFLWATIGVLDLLAAGAVRVNAAFATFNLPWLVGAGSLIFAPWTALMYVMIFPLNGFDWIWLGFGIMADVASYVGGYHNRKQVPMYPETAP